VNEPGLRERKKQQTRQRITQAAFELFAERGFDNVPVAQVAQAAEVSVATVFNDFPTKESLVYDGMARFETELVAAIRDRPAGTSILDTYRDVVVRPQGLLTSKDPKAADQLAAAARMIQGSAALRARERELNDHCTTELAAVIADETGAADGDITPWVLASALVGVHRALKEHLHRQVLDGRWGPGLAREMTVQGNRALDALADGLDPWPTAKKRRRRSEAG
jgi:AcrR family transcriptional regulator